MAMTDDSEKPTATDGIINDESQVDPNTPTIEVSDVLVENSNSLKMLE